MMSVFPKRTLRSTTVTIHCNLINLGLSGGPVSPIVVIAVKDPTGKETILFNRNVLLFPYQNNDTRGVVEGEKKQTTYLRKDVPLLILADYLSGKQTKEHLIDVLQNIESGQHYYFPFLVPGDAPLGKYSFICEVYLDGRVKRSSSVSDDCFWVEQLEFVGMSRKGSAATALIQNDGPEPVPARVVNCFSPYADDSNSSRIIDIPPCTQTPIVMEAPFTYLCYNEDRKVITLSEYVGPYLLRNPKIPFIKKMESVYLFGRDREEAFELTGHSKALWERANGLLRKDELSAQEMETYIEMSACGLIQEIFI